MQIIFYIPEKISTNKIYAGMHWTKRKRITDMFRKVPFVAQPITEYPVHCHYHFILVGKPLDILNHGFLAKEIEDSLVAKGILKDDTQKFVSGVTITAEQGKENVCRVTIQTGHYPNF